MILIIPDIHFELNQYHKIMGKYSHIKNKVSLGDWYDSHEEKYHSVEHVVEIARNHRDFIENPDHICLFGNHDMQYAFPHVRGFSCTGWDSWKQMPIDKYMRNSWKFVKLFHWATINKREWLLSHAGFHSDFIHPDNRVLGNDYIESPIAIREHLTDLCDRALFRASNGDGMLDDVLSVGRIRGGYHPHGGCTWMDWKDFKPTDNINQIVGHSHGKSVRIINTNLSENYCIDANSKKEYLGFVAILNDDGNCMIEKVL